MSEFHGLPGVYRVAIRRQRRLGQVRSEAEALDGREFEFRPGWTLTSEDRAAYAGEQAMIAVSTAERPYPDEAPVWIASGDLVFVAEKTYPKVPPQVSQGQLLDTEGTA